MVVSETLPCPDVEIMIRDLRMLVEIESPSNEPVGVSRVMNVVEGWARDLNAETHALPGGLRQFHFGACVGGGAAGAQPILVLAHADTVWPHGTLQTMPWRRDGGRLYGPGTYDMKAGIVGVFHALRALQHDWPAGGIQVLLLPDGETGSVGSKASIEAAARHARAALVMDPPLGCGDNSRPGHRGTGNFSLSFQGVASQAGNTPEAGASAITAAVKAVTQLQALARHERGTTLNVGRIQGGSAVNVIPAECVLDVDLRVTTLAEARRITDAVQAMTPDDPRVKLTVQGGLTRPPVEPKPATETLFVKARAIGFTLNHRIGGGEGMGNLTAPLIPTLDGLGAPGGGAHASHEHIWLDHWPQHVRLLARLLRDI